MKKLSFVFVMCLVSMTLKSQYSITTLKFSETQHDFGVFREEAGRQTFNFIVTNTGNQPLVIQKVTASCGCTTPEWTRQPIASGGQGKVTAIYDPANRPGVFDKTLTVYTNTKPASTTLTIKGEVTPREKTVEELFTFPVGAVRFESNNLAFANVKKTELKNKEMQIINTSANPVKVEFDILPAHLKLKAEPVTLKPGQKGRVTGTYDAPKNSGWGYVNDMVKIKLNNVLQENVYYYVSANLVEDFSSLSKEDMANAPVFKLVTATANLGKIKGSSQYDVEFKFTNEGKRDLIIRHIRSTCGCTAVQQENQGVGIKPGESSSIKAVFNSGGYKGKVTKSIYVYTNDPKNSEAVLMLNAEVD
ncbi:MAG: hypothetical protein A2V46_08130 [Bacteroidetes bacterium RBG_19FT_COMBO_42_7]|nr:MAG: hypothetical protein A2V46_08130 [Bacteroidetes bacterium RBG_19FT_COMBO_42_7]